MDQVCVHPRAEDSPEAIIGSDTSALHESQVQEGAALGADCIVSKGAYVGFEARNQQRT
jgi:UDP-2-acetamido-3-amino-2,3-dideoxy-glucuronate N-acetyltransferase